VTERSGSRGAWLRAGVALVVVPAATLVAGGCAKEPTAPPITVRVTPKDPTLHVNEIVAFTVEVKGVFRPQVIWSVDEGPSGGTISAEGIYTAPAALPSPATVTVRASLESDSRKTATATATVTILGVPARDGFALFPAGSFTLGDGNELSHCGETEYPVTLTHDFYLSQAEVTNQEYMDLVQWAYDRGYVTVVDSVVLDNLDGGTAALLYLDDYGSEIAMSEGRFVSRYIRGHRIEPRRPVKEVTWFGAAAYCDWLSLREGLPRAYDHSTWICNGEDPSGAVGYRLPTDAEWEYAGQYDDGRVYPWGNQEPSTPRENYLDWIGWTTIAGKYAPEKVVGDKPIYDMVGNVWEWCNDWWRCKADPEAFDPPGPASGETRVLRGASWYTVTAWRSYIRCSNRESREPTFRNGLTGFRVARTVTD